jgi:activator of HSP90 ATPase
MEFTIKAKIKATAEKIYSAWLNSEGHTKMTGGEALVSDKEGDIFSAWDGYIEGRNIKLEPFSIIIQTWRTSEFEDKDEDSQIELILRENQGVTEITLIHRNLTESGEQYRQGWIDNYFEPMKTYFSKK